MLFRFVILAIEILGTKQPRSPGGGELYEFMKLVNNIRKKFKGIDAHSIILQVNSSTMKS